MFSPTSPVTGCPQTGFTSPTYSLTADNAASPLAKQFYVSAIGGTQTGVETHTLSKPFLASFERPGVPKTVPPKNAMGVYPNFPNNVYREKYLRGVVVTAEGHIRIAMCKIEWIIPAGAEQYDAANVRALAGLKSGLGWQQSAGIGDTFIVGTI
jgi:hypothetical protein